MSSSWGSHSKLVFDNSGRTENLTNIPVLVTLNSGNIDYSKTQDSGEDIRFIDGTTGAELEYEIEEWNESGDSFVWVNVPQIDGSSDHIWLYHNNGSASDAQYAAGVWDANYVGVWHLEENGSGAADEYVDSSGTGNHAQGGDGAAGDTPSQIAGQIGTGQDFDGTSEFIAIPKVSNDFNGDVGTASFWMTADAVGSWMAALEMRVAGGFDNSMAMWWNDPSDFQITYRAGGGFFNHAADEITDNSDWHLVTQTWDAGADEAKQFVDGSQVGNTETDLGVWAGTIDIYPTIGANGAVGRDGDWDGIIDEVRISTIARSPDWIAAQHLSMTDAFITYE